MLKITLKVGESFFVRDKEGELVECILQEIRSKNVIQMSFSNFQGLEVWRSAVYKRIYNEEKST